MPGRGQFGVGGARSGPGKGIAGQRAIAQPPCGQPFHPCAFGHPFTAAFGRSARQFERGGVVVFDIVAPRHPLAPFGTGITGKLPVSLGQQALGFGRVIGLDRF